MIDKSLCKTQKPTVLIREATRRKNQYVNPAVDIFESADALTLIADMPGLDEKSLDVSIEDGVLTIKGEAATATADFRAQEFAMAGYWRQFRLPDSFDAEEAKASVKHGVMILEVPKAEAAKPKRVEVTVH